MEKHINLLGLLFIVYGIMGCIGALIVMVVFVGGGLFAGRSSGESELALIAGTFGGVLTAIILIGAVPSIIAGYGLMKQRPWSRVLGLVMGIINLPGLPFGTALGVYAIWVLIHDETVALFNAMRS